MSEEHIEIVDDNNRDNPADEAIRDALCLDKPQSFFLFAGAGSGKTRSLKSVLETLADIIGSDLRRRGRKIAVITYTNVACDEILRRVNSDPIFDVKTIHSFAWSLVEGRNHDIRKWLLEEKLPADLAKIEEKHAKGRAGKEHDKRKKQIASKKKRIEELPNIHHFTYNPNGDNVGRASLSHDEVIAMASSFLMSKETFQKIVLSKYPFILIDESQDTLKPFMLALLEFEKAHQSKLALGLFGDTMQRIYGHGLPDLVDRIPERWDKPAKVMNHRSRARIIDLANSIRADADKRSQRPRSDRAGGFVHVFIAPNEGTDREQFEADARLVMAEITSDEKWRVPSAVKTLTIERHMAAARLGFSGLFEPLDKVDSFQTSFRDGTLASMRLFSERILPVIEHNNSGDAFGLMAILRKHSPLLSKSSLSITQKGQLSGLGKARFAVKDLTALFVDDADPSCGDVLKSVAASGLFEIPEVLKSLSSLDFSPNAEFEPTNDDRVDAWAVALRARFSEVSKYRDYVLDLSPYGTHQGVKGLEFPRVMVIADDGLTRFKGLASYEKLLGARAKSDRDLKNEREGKETTFDRTRRLLYVTCTRAEESLAIVVYSDDPSSVADTMMSKGWVTSDEISKGDNLRKERATAFGRVLEANEKRRLEIHIEQTEMRTQKERPI
ncbi:pathogenesis-related protein [Pseudovibrio sp. FO-BEG1]|uniref:UvrD-helicase domain-containing protein n=1 Tax=Pseudovibrio sp. (strain FO-BEG1) TaxID=911045 RepID=UPI000238C74C|nr:UvrD-helicase domain-containing protein [Pseudovibrio sp. FO-BEG1]AEV38431.1 pathogenesis-related protein [Pseudovibrio sp. FO-BEG1]